MFLLFVLSTFLVPSQQQPIEDFRLLGRSFGALEYRTLEFYRFKGLPTFPELASDEKREIYHYEQTIAVRDSDQEDKTRRCEMMEVYQEEEAHNVKQMLTALLHIEIQELPSMKKMMDIMDDCDSIDNVKGVVVTEPPNKEWPTDKDSNEEKRALESNPIFNGIVPGTNWCGFGDIANSYHDLGGLHDVDRCCRSHDLCPIKVLGKDKRYNLTNEAIYTKSHCLCDERFYNCLKKDNGWSAKFIGNLYFYVASPQCVAGLPENPGEQMKFVPATKKWQKNVL